MFSLNDEKDLNHHRPIRSTIKYCSCEGKCGSTTKYLHSTSLPEIEISTRLSSTDFERLFTPSCSLMIIDRLFWQKLEEMNLNEMRFQHSFIVLETISGRFNLFELFSLTYLKSKVYVNQPETTKCSKSYYKIYCKMSSKQCTPANTATVYL